MTTRLHATVLPVADLIDRPGVSRRLDLVLPVPTGLDLTLAQVVEPVRFAGEVASVVEGLLVRGALHAQVRLQCARCLEDVPSEILTDVAELFSDPLRVDELGPGVVPENVIEVGYEIIDGAIDLDTLLRDALVPQVPWRPLCDPDCAGLCPVCGVHRDEVECDCEESTVERRWAALENLRLDGS